MAFAPPGDDDAENERDGDPGERAEGGGAALPCDALKNAEDEREADETVDERPRAGDRVERGVVRHPTGYDE